MKYKTCAFIGSTPDELEFGYDEDSHEALKLRAAIAAKLLLLLQDGCTSFISTLEQGAELWAAEACLTVAKLGGKAELCAVPISENQAIRWHPQLRDRYYDVIEASDEVIEPRCVESSEDYILENADIIVVVGNRLGERVKRLIGLAEKSGVAIEQVTA